jgi:hypothetical protein
MYASVGRDIVGRRPCCGWRAYACQTVSKRAEDSCHHGTFRSLDDTHCQLISPHNLRLVDLAPSNRQALVVLPETDSDVQRQSWLVLFGYVGWVVDSGDSEESCGSMKLGTSSSAFVLCSHALRNPIPIRYINEICRVQLDRYTPSRLVTTLSTDVHTLY